MATKIIAEAGVNHNGSVELAFKLIEAAKFSGADTIKFQTFKSESLSDSSAPLANYQKNNNLYKSQIEMLRSLELSDDETRKIVKACKDVDIEFMSSPFGVDELYFLTNLGMKTIKIPSGEITNLSLLKETKNISLKNNAKILMSTGMSNLGDIENALSILDFQLIKEKITILHCVSCYPAPSNELNLLALKTLQNSFNCKVGYSDHSKNIIAPIVSIALGSSVIEKHLTLDNDLPGPDHKASINPKVFKEMVNNIREAERMLGNGIKVAQESELDTKFVARRSIRASRFIKKGSKISEEDLVFKRPGDGLSPMEVEKIIGSISSKDYKYGELIFDISI
tara:strand:- start:10928 stop:11944 length:1017 start_codon:yes stop_codon:yes gene_type:complete